MKRREILQSIAALGVLRLLPSCAPKAGGGRVAPLSPADAAFVRQRDGYFRRFLALNPVTCTYLGGDGWGPGLAEVNGKLRDFRPLPLAAERRYYEETRDALAKGDLAALSPSLRIDHQVLSAQVGFVLHQHGLRYWERSVDAYVAEPFRGIDWQMQQLGPASTRADWDRVVSRVQAVREYFETAKANLLAGKQSKNVPDRRLVKKDGIAAAIELAEFFEKTLPDTAAPLLDPHPFKDEVLGLLRTAAMRAGGAASVFALFLKKEFDPENDTKDHYACGEAEYAWRVKNCLQVAKTPAELWELGAAEVERYEREAFRVAEEIAHAASLSLPFGSDLEKRSSTRAVMERIAKDAPKSDEELFRWYREACARAVQYGRLKKMFAIPAGYTVELVETPPVLRNAIDAAYYPAPPFKKGGVGRFYLTPPGNDPEKLAIHTKGYVADTAVHEGFPGHDWHYVFMNANAATIANVRWATPGAVEDSTSMWQDSMASEGWGLYAEELMAEPAPGRPYGFYDAAEYLFELQGQLLRAARVRIDVGLHTGRMTYEEALEYYSVHVNFYPGACVKGRGEKAEETAKALCEDAEHQVYRYSKWPTQAITYSLGKTEIQALRKRAETQLGKKFSARAFHEGFMKQGTIPSGYFADVLLGELAT